MKVKKIFPLFTAVQSLRHLNSQTDIVFKVKGEGFPQQAEVAQGVPGRLRPPHKGGSSSAMRTGRLYRRRNPWYSLSEAESTSGPMVLSGVPRKKSPVTTSGSGVPRGGLGCSNPPEIPKIPVETSIAQARRTGVSISFCSSLCSHTVVIY